MLQLKNIAHNFDVVRGDVGVTIRKGSKWDEYSEGTKMELRVCPAAGCHTSNLSNGCHNREKLREILVKNDAVYLGDFNDVFAERIRP